MKQVVDREEEGKREIERLGRAVKREIENVLHWQSKSENLQGSLNGAEEKMLKWSRAIWALIAALNWKVFSQAYLLAKAQTE